MGGVPLSSYDVLVWRVSEQGGFTVLELQGSVDSVTVPLFRRALTEALAVGRRVLVDLRATTFFGVLGIRALQAAVEEGGQIEVVAPPAVRRLFELVGLTQVLAPEPAEAPAPEAPAPDREPGAT